MEPDRGIEKSVMNIKRSQLELLAQHREQLRKFPHLRWLFFEITDRCNLKCMHCGSNCTSEGSYLTIDDIKAALRSVSQDKPMICLTGGEPMLHPDFFEIASCISDMGFLWGMTTNATLIDDAAARRLKQAGLGTVSVSLDGMEQSHDLFRRQTGAWNRAVRGLQALRNAGIVPQVTTVLHRDNFHELEALYDFLCDMGITSWRPINIEPIGRACESSGLLLKPDQFSHLISFIRDKRFDRNCKMEVTFGCSHYLGVQYERMVRDHYFLCGAGILTASIRCNGDICACLDIVNKPELVQGNIHSDDFMDVWLHRFEAFRRDRTADCSQCIVCPERDLCGGDSAHTWNYDRKEPLLCYHDFQSFLNE